VLGSSGDASLNATGALNVKVCLREINQMIEIH
jgi:hypothetical protein